MFVTHKLSAALLGLVVVVVVVVPTLPSNWANAATPANPPPASPAPSPVALSRAQALKGLAQRSVATRRASVDRLGAIGTMADADRLAERLRDDDDTVRELAAMSMWRIWNRSGDPAIDATYQRALTQMDASQLRESVVTLTEVIRLKPEFAEAWNKRATAYYLLNEFDLSLQDCDEVMKRNPNHFGALSGYGQIYLNLGNFERAKDYFERALTVNPNLAGTALIIQQIKQRLEEKKRNTI